MKKVILIIIFFSSINIYAQTMSNETLIGTWFVENIQAKIPKDSPDSEKEAIQIMKFQFEKAQFHFYKDKSFELEISIPDLRSMTTNSKWQIVSNKIQITKGEDLIMEISYLVHTGKTYFVITEFPFLLEIKK